MNKQELLRIAKPILFNTEMVQAIIGNRKTATRRVNKSYIPEKAEWGYTAFTPKGYISCRGYFESGYGEKFYKLKYNPGDILYVRETWGISTQLAGGIIYRADYKDRQPPLVDSEKWHPSIHMPKEAARLFLKVTNVRVERLQDITEKQCLAEGATLGLHTPCNFDFFWNPTIPKKDLNKYGWDANPWVWVYEFERLEVSA